MEYLVSITSQGQISIPAPLRRLLALEKYRKAFVSLEDKKIVVEPAEDLLSLKGAFKTNKKIPFQKTREGFIEYLAVRTK